MAGNLVFGKFLQTGAVKVCSVHALLLLLLIFTLYWRTSTAVLIFPYVLTESSADDSLFLKNLFKLYINSNNNAISGLGKDPVWQVSQQNQSGDTLDGFHLLCISSHPPSALLLSKEMEGWFPSVKNCSSSCPISLRPSWSDCQQRC